MRSLRTCLLLLTLLLAILPACAQLEGKYVTLEIRDQSLDAVLKSWRKEHDVVFAYDSGLLKQDTVNASFVNEPLENALRQVLTPHHLEFSLVGRTVVISPEIEEPQVYNPEREHFEWSGRVIDQDTGESLPFATLQVAGTGIGTNANEDGRFVFRDMPSDTSTVVIKYVGYDDKRIRLSPHDFKNENLIELKMHRGLLPQAIIYGESPHLIKTEKMPGMQTISCSELLFVGSAASPDVLKSAQLIPGIDATGESGNGLNIRGSDADQSLVQMDGYTIYHMDHFFGVFSAFNPSTIKALRVHKGVLPVSEGGRTGGRVELIAKDGNANKFSAQLDAGLLTTSVLLEGPLGKNHKTTFMVGYRRAYTDLYQGPTFKYLFNNLYNSSVADASEGEVDAFESGQDPSLTFYDLTAKLTFQPTARDKIQLSFYNGNDDFSLSETDTISNDRFYYRNSDETSWGNTGASVRWMNAPGNKFSFENSASYSHYKSNSFSSDSLLDLLSLIDHVGSRFENNKLDDFTLRTSVNYNYLKHSLTFGIVYSFLRVDHSRNISTEEDNTSSDELQQSNIPVIFLQDNWQVRDNFEIDGGIRLTWYEPSERLYFEPRISAVFSANKNIDLKMSAGRSVQYIHRVQVQAIYPSAADYWKLSDGTTLPVMQSDQVSAGINSKFRGFRLDTELYWKWNTGTFENLTPYFPVAGVRDTMLLSTGNGQAYGADVLLQKDLRRHHFWIGYGYLQSWNKFAEFGDSRIPESFAQQHEFKTVYQLKLEHWDFSAAFFYGSGKPFTPLLGAYDLELVNGTTQLLPVYGEFNSARLPEYRRVDLSVAYFFDWGKTNCRIVASAFNVFDHTNLQDIDYYILPGSEDDGTFTIAQNEVLLLGFVPSLFISFKW